MMKAETSISRIWLIVWTILYSVASSPVQLLAQTQELKNTPQQSYEDRIHNLERDKKDLEAELNRVKDNYSALKEEFGNFKKDDFHDFKEEFKQYEPFMKNWQWVWGGFGVGLIVFLSTFLYQFFFKTLPNLKKEILEKAKADIDSNVTKILADQRTSFLSLLKEYDKEQQAKEKYNIVMLTHKEGSDNYHYEKLTKHGFKVNPLTTIAQLSDAQFTADDIIIINNEEDHWKSNEIEDFINTHTNLCFYVGRGQIKTNASARNRFAAANFRPQFVGNFLNFIIYHN